MIIDWQNIKIFIKPGFTDFRKQINGLIGIYNQVVIPFKSGKHSNML